MIALLERLLPLWTEPVDGPGDPKAAFGEVYAGLAAGHRRADRTRHRGPHDRRAHDRWRAGHRDLGGGRRPRPAPPARRGPAERLTRDTASERSPASPLRCRATPRFAASDTICACPT